ncbi:MULTISPECIES: hypothetical protein [Thiomicrorhabdus]|uniref:Uncharacterized protein n=1 Tax=Thiomicrorhabdus heinhorstiae TaxID=2748010 RepID=A0ABS0BWH7_9GAMM|nr:MULTISPECIES: hypothetical protein [Thiomicrorhabdus]MBF6058168.1 hypothetical protein [Thiomicrorhabdus heinhorstiae]
MNLEQFTNALDAMSDEDLQLILDDADKGLIVVRDETLGVGASDQAYVIYELGEDKFASVADLRNNLSAQAETMLKEYYQFNPLSKEFFNKEVQKLFNEHGELSFISTPKKPASKAIFVENEQVLCLDEDEPRFKYAFKLELDDSYAQPQAQLNKVKNWIQSGSAYQDYISVNVCRFSAIE